MLNRLILLYSVTFATEPTKHKLFQLMRYDQLKRAKEAKDKRDNFHQCQRPPESNCLHDHEEEAAALHEGFNNTRRPQSKGLVHHRVAHGVHARSEHTYPEESRIELLCRVCHRSFRAFLLKAPKNYSETQNKPIGNRDATHRQVGDIEAHAQLRLGQVLDEDDVAADLNREEDGEQHRDPLGHSLAGVQKCHGHGLLLCHVGRRHLALLSAVKELSH